MSSYAARRAAMLARNKEALKNIERDFPAAPPPPSSPAPKTPSKPKVAKPAVARQNSEPASPRTPGSRSSSRARKPITRFSEEKYSDEEGYFSVEEDSEEEGSEAEEGEGKKKKRRMSTGGSGIPKRLSGGRPNPKVFGHQRGSEVGRSWNSRMACSQSGVHAPPVSGIYGSEEAGAWSVALSGGYEDDIDVGYAFTFTGSGGRALGGTKDAPKNLRTAPQSFDQQFTAQNAALQRSVETKKPVRVIRGFKGHSCFAPTEGYRYDGLYIITRAWMDVGESGFRVCKFSFIRMGGQPDIPVRAGCEEEAAAIIAEYGKGGDVGQPAPARSPVKAIQALKSITPVKSPKKKAATEGSQAEVVKSPASVKRPAVEVTAEKVVKLARVGSRSSPRAPSKKQ